MRQQAYGERAVLCDVPAAEVPAWQHAIAQLPEVADAVAGAQTVLALARPDVPIETLHRLLDALQPTPLDPRSGPELVLSVDYDGADLAEVADRTGLDPAQVVELHTAGSYMVRFCGFSPGFAYLDGLDPRLHVPRREQPRTSVPAGSVAVAGQFSAVYPRGTPGGWQLLGRTDAELWDLDRDPPALLAPGSRVRFVAR
jgi:KipI family sensor histidine kinase inhibitor